MDRRNFLKALGVLAIPSYAMAEKVITTKDGIKLTIQETISAKSPDKNSDELGEFIKGKIETKDEDSLGKLMEEKGKLDKNKVKKGKEVDVEKNNLTNSQKYNKTKNNIGEIELSFFSEFFGVKTEDDFVKKVIEIQEDLGIKPEFRDGIIGVSTLKGIYIKHYSKNVDNLPLEIKKRLSIYSDMKLYSGIKSALSGKLEVFNNNTFYGDSIGINIKGTYINENLNGKVAQNIPEKINKIEFVNIGGKSVLLFYVKGNLEVATYVSPGLYTGEKRTPKLKTTGKLEPHKLHISSEYPKIKDEKGNVTKKGGAVMPYATHIDGAIWIHGTDGKLDGNPA